MVKKNECCKKLDETQEYKISKVVSFALYRFGFVEYLRDRTGIAKQPSDQVYKSSLGETERSSNALKNPRLGRKSLIFRLKYSTKSKISKLDFSQQILDQWGLFKVSVKYLELKTIIRF